MKHSIGKQDGMIPQSMLIASAVVAFLSVIGFLIVPLSTTPLADMHIEPLEGVVRVGETFTVDVMVNASTPVNVFKGEIQFDHEKLSVDSIDYNTSIADLWAERPWYENGEGTLNFIGGTTQKGGFLGKGSLIKISFRSLSPGEALIHVTDARILEHNGLGTDVTVKEPIDTIFNVTPSSIDAETIARPEPESAAIDVIPESPSTDLNGDGKQTIADVSIFMLGMFGDDPKFDFNQDGEVDTKDLSILMSVN